MTKLLWIDLETNGLDPFDNFILEIGMIVTDINLAELGRKSWVVRPPLDVATLQRVTDDFVVDMHTKNGLWEDIETNGRSLHDVVLPEVEGFIQTFARPDGIDSPVEKLHPAGSSVHFDLAFLQEVMSHDFYQEYLHHRNYDVSSIKMFFETVVGEYDRGPEDPHRALGDLENDLKWVREAALICGRTFTRPAKLTAGICRRCGKSKTLNEDRVCVDTARCKEAKY